MGYSQYRAFALLGVMGLVSGCSGFGETFKADQSAWAEQPGNKTLAVQIQGDDDLHPQLSCASADDDVLLMPDTKYYRDYLRVDLSQAGFKEKVGRKGAPLIRHVSHSADCRFVFANLPAGNWLLVTRPQFFGRDEDSQQDSARPVAPPVFMWNAITVSADTDLTAVQVDKDLSKIVRKKHKHVHKHISKHSKKRRREFRGDGSPDTQLVEWNLTATDRQQLGLPALALPATPVAPAKP